ncbi:THAP domain-containing 2-like [Paramuricea clavata]|uniref:THAP domain-containing 2-like n=1 Tax=Paramuricea clavata TaxID=317549 RepID=A0A7D9DKB0_PARCT|nr:THAP domain-containing 2-like [Paramuricea clavata]
MPGKGGKYCVAGFSGARSCRNSSNTKGISMHMFPRGDKQRAAWTKFVRRHRPVWDPTSSSALCSAHFHGNDFTQRLDINVPTAPDRSPSNISCKRYLKHGTIPTVDDYDVASKFFPETSAALPTTPHIPTAKVERAKRQLLREVSQSSVKRSKIVDESISMAENEDLEIEVSSGDQSGLTTESLSQDQSVLLGEKDKHTKPEETDELFTCKRKLKTAQQRCSNYRRTIKRLQLQVKSKSSSDSASPTPMVEFLNEQNEVENLPDEFDGNLAVDPNELDDYLAEADDMSSLKNDPDWEVEDELDPNDGEDAVEFNEKNQVR